MTIEIDVLKNQKVAAITGDVVRMKTKRARSKP
jgi:hypothetical protein